MPTLPRYSWPMMHEVYLITLAWRPTWTMQLISAIRSSDGLQGIFSHLQASSWIKIPTSYCNLQVISPSLLRRAARLIPSRIFYLLLTCCATLADAHAVDPTRTLLLARRTAGHLDPLELRSVRNLFGPAERGIACFDFSSGATQVLHHQLRIMNPESGSHPSSGGTYDRS